METPAATRSYLLGQILGSPLAWGVNTVLAFLLWGDVIATTFPQTDVVFHYLAPLTALSWQRKVIITLVVNIALFLEVSLRAVRRQQRQRDEYQKKLQLIEQARPHLVPCEPDAPYVEQVHIQATGNVTNVVSFIKARFVNKPAGPPFPNCVAREVRAKIRYFEAKPGGRLLLAIDGIWGDGRQPLIRNWRQHRGDLLKVDFGIEEEQSLDIAFRDDDAGELYAFNNENYGYPQMKKPEHLLAGQQFLVRISLLGPWIDEGLEFLMTSDSAGAKVTGLSVSARKLG